MRAEVGILRGLAAVVVLLSLASVVAGQGPFPATELPTRSELEALLKQGSIPEKLNACLSRAGKHGSASDDCLKFEYLSHVLALVSRTTAPPPDTALRRNRPHQIKKNENTHFIGAFEEFLVDKRPFTDQMPPQSPAIESNSSIAEAIADACGGWAELEQQQRQQQSEISLRACSEPQQRKLRSALPLPYLLEGHYLRRFQASVAAAMDTAADPSQGPSLTSHWPALEILSSDSSAYQDTGVDDYGTMGTGRPQSCPLSMHLVVWAPAGGVEARLFPGHQVVMYAVHLFFSCLFLPLLASLRSVPLPHFPCLVINFFSIFFPIALFICSSISISISAMNFMNFRQFLFTLRFPVFVSVSVPFSRLSSFLFCLLRSTPNPNPNPLENFFFPAGSLAGPETRRHVTRRVRSSSRRQRR
jgi:hypothetical protein